MIRRRHGAEAEWAAAAEAALQAVGIPRPERVLRLYPHQLSGGMAQRILIAMALINRPSYGQLMENHAIDIVISPQTITIGTLLAHVRRGDVVRVHSLRRGAAEAIEAVVHGTQGRSRVIGRPLEKIDLPPGASIVAIVRGERVIMAHHDTTIEAEDHVIIFLSDRRHIDAVSRLFQSDA